MCWSERVIFTNMRAAFHSEEARSRWPSPNARSGVGGRSAAAEDGGNKGVESGNDAYGAQRAFVQEAEGEAARTPADD